MRGLINASFPNHCHGLISVSWFVLMGGVMSNHVRHKVKQKLTTSQSESASTGASSNARTCTHAHTHTHARRDRLLDKPTQCFQSHLYDSHQESGQLLAALNHVLHQHQTENPDTNLRHLESARQSIGLSLALVRWRLTGMIQWDTGQTIHLQTIHKQLEGKYSLKSTDPHESEISAHLRP